MNTFNVKKLALNFDYYIKGYIFKFIAEICDEQERERVFSVSWLISNATIWFSHLGSAASGTKWCCESKQKLCEKIPGLQVLTAKLDVWMRVCVHKKSSKTKHNSKCNPPQTSLCLSSFCLDAHRFNLPRWSECVFKCRRSIIIKHTHTYTQRVEKSEERE